ncbi:MAG TPA: hypothetical protein VLJ60_07060, partial [bacterium]|nr:hypothetical protein [bacterium]
VRFRRIFNGGIVRGNISKISIKLDPDGSLRNMRIEWPEFQEVADSLDLMSFEENLSILVTGLSSDKGTHVVLSSTATLEIDGYEIDGAAKAWLPVEKDGEILIIPGMSYKLNVFVTGDEPVLTKIVDYPLVPDFVKFNEK